eukprot:scaffold121781_cov72-Phaeocystis_antarctica.AAC.1
MPNGRITRSIGSRSPGRRPGGGSRLKTRRQAERAKETPVTKARPRRSRTAIRASCRSDSSEGESDIADLGSRRRAQTLAGAPSWRSLRNPMFGNVGVRRRIPSTGSVDCKFARSPGAPKPSAISAFTMVHEDAGLLSVLRASAPATLNQLAAPIAMALQLAMFGRFLPTESVAAWIAIGATVQASTATYSAALTLAPNPYKPKPKPTPKPDQFVANLANFLLVVSMARWRP